MFADLKLIVDLIRDGVSDFRNRKAVEDRDRIALNLLKTYFLLKDCVEEGEELINEAGPDPITAIREMDKTSADATLRNWDAKLDRQGHRLFALQRLISSQNFLAVISPGLQERIAEIVGYKLTRTNSLHGIGAAFYFRRVFPKTDSIERSASYVSLMAGSDTDWLDADATRQELQALRQSLEQYRQVVMRLASPHEITRLADKARSEPLIDKSAPNRPQMQLGWNACDEAAKSKDSD